MPEKETGKGGTGATRPEQGGPTGLPVDVSQLTDDQKKQLLELLKSLVKPARTRQPREIPENIKVLVEEYNNLKTRLREIRQRLKELGYTPTGITVRRGYGNYDYRGSKAYETVKEIIRSSGYITREQLEEKLKEHGYKGITGTVGVVLKNLKEDGLIRPAPGGYQWVSGQST
jgi:DNA-binding PadR family transcriptional regulator